MKIYNFVLLGIFSCSCIGYAPSGEGNLENSESETLEHLYQDDAGTGADVVVDRSSPYEIDFGDTKGTLIEFDADTYGAYLPAGELVEVSLSTESESLDAGFELFFYNSFNDIDVNEKPKGETESFAFLTDKTMKSSKFAVEVYSAGGTGKYTLSLTRQKQNDGNSQADAPGDADSAYVLVPGTYLENMIGNPDESDYFAIEVEANQRITITATPIDSELDLKLLVGAYCYDSCNWFDEVNDSFRGKAETHSEIPDEYDPVIYRFAVSTAQGGGKYKLQVSTE